MQLGLHFKSFDMPTFPSQSLLHNLRQDVEKIQAQTIQLSGLSQDLLQAQPAANSWSIVQVIAHLNSYNRYYLPQIARAMAAGASPAAPFFKPGFFGNYFTKMMQPPVNPQSFKKYKAPKDHTPPAGLDGKAVLHEFLEAQQQLQQLLQMAGQKDLGKIKVPVSISRFIKLKLGDTFRFLIAHQLRHFLQIERILKNAGVATLSDQHIPVGIQPE